MSTLGWMASVASGTFVVTSQIEAMLLVTNPDFAFSRWQYTLIMLAFQILNIAFNTYGAPILPALETVCLFAHILGFFIVWIPLLVLCPKNSAYEVFADFQDNSGYGNMGAAYLISQVYVMYCSLGSDCVVHISEEVEDASLTVPRVMIWSYVGNVTAGLVMLITMLFCIGPLQTVASRRSRTHSPPYQTDPLNSS
jgi:amino acid transporter